MSQILEKLPLKNNIETARILKQLSITSRALAELKGIAKTKHSYKCYNDK